MNSFTIELTAGKQAIVDREDFFPLLMAGKWRAMKDRNRNYYACRGSNGEKSILMHREILGAKEVEKVDHKNHNGLDNRRENLRKCTNSQNLANSKIRKDNKSGFRGVNRMRNPKNPLKFWRAQIQVNNKEIHLGHFGTKEEAAIAYNEGAVLHFGEFANLNKIPMDT